jgi:hypothetical protein
MKIKLVVLSFQNVLALLYSTEFEVSNYVFVILFVKVYHVFNLLQYQCS